MTMEKIKVDGVMSAILLHADGTKEEFAKHNLIVDAGVDFMCAALGSSGARPAALSHIALGTGTSLATTSQIGLQTETARKAAAYAHTNGTPSFTMTATFNAGEATGALTEAGVFNASSGGVMFDRVVFPVINKEANDVLTMTFTFSMSVA